MKALSLATENRIVPSFLLSLLFRQVLYISLCHCLHSAPCVLRSHSSQTGKYLGAAMRVSTRVFPTRHTPTGVRFRASLTTAAVDRGRPVACRVERYLSPLLFYGVVERFSSASKVCVWCTTAAASWLCRRPLAWCSDRVGRRLCDGVHSCLWGIRREHCCGELGVYDHRADLPRPL